MATKKGQARNVSRPMKKTVAAKKKTTTKTPATKQKVEKQTVKKPGTKKPPIQQMKKKSAARKTAQPQVVARQAVTTPPPALQPIISANRPSWVDELTQTPLIDDYARQLESFISAMADGHVDESEVKNQEQRVVSLLREIDPQLDDTLHTKVTELLCELTAYAIMQMLYAMEQARPKTVFQG